MNSRNILITIKKELRSIFRDKKTLGMILGFPFVIALFIFFFGYAEDAIMGSGESTYKIGINYESNEVLDSLADEYNLEAMDYKSMQEMREAYDSGDISGYVDFNKDSNKYVIYTGTDVTGMNVNSLITSYLMDYNNYLGNLRLMDKNIDPEEIFNNFKIEAKNVTGEELSTSSFMVEMIMGISFTYIIMAIALATVNMATSAIAVEKEHGTLETILTLPITTTELIVGKYLATVIIGVISSVIGFIITMVSFGVARGMFEMYAEFSVSFQTIVYGVVICLVASLLIAGLSIAITSSAKTYKEAQAAGQILSIVCVVPMFFTYLNITVTNMYYAIPILNYTTILMDLYTGNFSYMNLFMTICSTIVYTLIILWLLLNKFKSEKVLFG